jgi:hypothetical protein
MPQDLSNQVMKGQTLYAKQEVKACDVIYTTFSAVTMTSTLTTSQFERKGVNVLPNNLTNVTNDSKPIKGK